MNILSFLTEPHAVTLPGWGWACVVLGVPALIVLGGLAGIVWVCSAFNGGRN